MRCVSFVCATWLVSKLVVKSHRFQGGCLGEMSRKDEVVQVVVLSEKSEKRVIGEL
jgi:hypothetical protein